MARFRRRRARRAATAGRRRGSRRGEGGLMNGALTAAVYGGVRGYASNLLQPVTSKLGVLGTYADNAAMIAALWAVGKFLPGMRPIAKTGILIEAAMVGGELVNQNMPTQSVQMKVYS